MIMSDHNFPLKEFLHSFSLISSISLEEVETYLEIGVRDGNSLLGVINRYPNLRKVIVCDTWGNEYGGSGKGNHNHITEMLSTQGFPLDKVVFLDGDSRKVIPQYFRSNPDEIYDVAFLDGSHSEFGVWIDMKNLIQHSYIMVVHDLRHPSHFYLRGVVLEFYNQVNKDFFLIEDGYTSAFFVRKDLPERLKRNVSSNNN